MVNHPTKHNATPNSTKRIFIAVLLLVCLLPIGTAFANGNAPPEIMAFDVSRYAGMIVVRGFVHDADEDTTGFTVNIFGGVMDTAVVDEYGRFTAVINDPDPNSQVSVHAVTSDSQGANSNIPGGSQP